MIGVKLLGFFLFIALAITIEESSQEITPAKEYTWERTNLSSRAVLTHLCTGSNDQTTVSTNLKAKSSMKTDAPLVFLGLTGEEEGETVEFFEGELVPIYKTCIELINVQFWSLNSLLGVKIYGNVFKTIRPVQKEGVSESELNFNVSNICGDIFIGSFTFKQGETPTPSGLMTKLDAQNVNGFDTGNVDFKHVLLSAIIRLRRSTTNPVTLGKVKLVRKPNGPDNNSYSASSDDLLKGRFGQWEFLFKTGFCDTDYTLTRFYVTKIEEVEITYTNVIVGSLKPYIYKIETVGALGEEKVKLRLGTEISDLSNVSTPHRFEIPISLDNDNHALISVKHLISETTDIRVPLKFAIVPKGCNLGMLNGRLTAKFSFIEKSKGVELPFSEYPSSMLLYIEDKLATECVIDRIDGRHICGTIKINGLVDRMTFKCGIFELTTGEVPTDFYPGIFNFGLEHSMKLNPKTYVVSLSENISAIASFQGSSGVIWNKISINITDTKNSPSNVEGYEFLLSTENTKYIEPGYSRYMMYIAGSSSAFFNFWQSEFKLSVNEDVHKNSEGSAQLSSSILLVEDDGTLRCDTNSPDKSMCVTLGKDTQDLLNNPTTRGNQLILPSTQNIIIGPLIPQGIITGNPIKVHIKVGFMGSEIDKEVPGSAVTIATGGQYLEVSINKLTNTDLGKNMCPMSNFFSVSVESTDVLATNSTTVQTYKLGSFMSCVTEAVTVSHVNKIIDELNSSSSPVLTVQFTITPTRSWELSYIKCGSERVPVTSNVTGSVTTDKCGAASALSAGLRYPNTIGTAEYPSIDKTPLRSVKLGTKDEGLFKHLTILATYYNGSDEVASSLQFMTIPLRGSPETTTEDLVTSCTDKSEHIGPNGVEYEYVCSKILYQQDWDGRYKISDSTTQYWRTADKSSFQGVLQFIRSVTHTIYLCSANNPIYLKQSDPLIFKFSLNGKTDSFPARITYEITKQGSDLPYYKGSFETQLDGNKDTVSTSQVPSSVHGMISKGEYSISIKNTLTAETNHNPLVVSVKIVNTSIKCGSKVMLPGLSENCLFITSTPTGILDYINSEQGASSEDEQYNCSNEATCSNEFNKANIGFFSDENSTYLVFGGTKGVPSDEVKGFKVTATVEGVTTEALKYPIDETTAGSYTPPSSYIYISPGDTTKWVFAWKVKDIVDKMPIHSLGTLLKNTKSVTFKVIMTAKNGNESEVFERTFLYVKPPTISHKRILVDQVPDTPPAPVSCKPEIKVRYLIDPPELNGILVFKEAKCRKSCLNGNDNPVGFLPDQESPGYSMTDKKPCSSDYIDVKARYSGYIGDFTTASTDISSLKLINNVSSSTDGAKSYLVIAIQGQSPLTSGELQLSDATSSTPCNFESSSFKCTDFEIPIDWEGEFTLRYPITADSNDNQTTVLYKVSQDIKRVLPPIKAVTINGYKEDECGFVYLQWTSESPATLEFDLTFETNVYPSQLSANLCPITIPNNCIYIGGCYSCSETAYKEGNGCFPITLDVRAKAGEDQFSDKRISTFDHSYLARAVNTTLHEEMAFKLQINNVYPSTPDISVRIKASSLGPKCIKQVYDQEGCFYSGNSDQGKTDVCMTFTQGALTHPDTDGSVCNEFHEYKNETNKDFSQFFSKNDLSTDPNKAFRISINGYQYNVWEIKQFQLKATYILSNTTKTKTYDNGNLSGIGREWQIYYDINEIAEDMEEGTECTYVFEVKTKSGMVSSIPLVVLKEKIPVFSHIFSYISDKYEHDWIALSHAVSGSAQLRQLVPMRATCQKRGSSTDNEIKSFVSNEVQINCIYGAPMDVAYGYKGLRGNKVRPSTDRTEIRGFDIGDVLITSMHDIELKFVCVEGHSNCQSSTNPRIIFVDEDVVEERLYGDREKSYPNNPGKRSTICNIGSNKRMLCEDVLISYKWSNLVRLFTKYTIIESHFNGSKIMNSIPYISSATADGKTVSGSYNEPSEAIYYCSTSGKNTLTVDFILSRETTQIVENLKLDISEEDVEQPPEDDGAFTEIKLKSSYTNKASSTISLKGQTNKVKIYNTKTYNGDESSRDDKSWFSFKLVGNCAEPDFCQGDGSNCDGVIFGPKSSVGTRINMPVFKKGDNISASIGPVNFMGSSLGDIQLCIKEGTNASCSEIDFFKATITDTQLIGGEPTYFVSVDNDLMPFKLNKIYTLTAKVCSVSSTCGTGSNKFWFVTNTAEHKFSLIDRSIDNEEDMSESGSVELGISTSLSCPQGFSCTSENLCSKPKTDPLPSVPANLVCEGVGIITTLTFPDAARQVVKYISSMTNKMIDYNYSQTGNELNMIGICNASIVNPGSSCLGEGAKVSFSRTPGGELCKPKAPNDLNEGYSTVSCSALTMPSSWDGVLGLSYDGTTVINMISTKSNLAGLVPPIKSVLINGWETEGNEIYLTPSPFKLENHLLTSTTSFIDKLEMEILKRDSETIISKWKLDVSDCCTNATSVVSKDVDIRSFPQSDSLTSGKYRLKIKNTPTYSHKPAESTTKNLESFFINFSFVSQSDKTNQFMDNVIHLNYLQQQDYPRTTSTETRLFFKDETIKCVIGPYNPQSIPVYKYNISVFVADGDADDPIIKEEFLLDVYPLEQREVEPFEFQIETKTLKVSGDFIMRVITTPADLIPVVNDIPFSVIEFNKLPYHHTFLNTQKMSENAVYLRLQPNNPPTVTSIFELISKKGGGKADECESGLCFIPCSSLQQVTDFSVFFKVALKTASPTNKFYERTMMGELENGFIGVDIVVSDVEIYGDSITLIPVFATTTNTTNVITIAKYWIESGQPQKDCTVDEKRGFVLCRGHRPTTNWDGTISTIINGTLTVVGSVEQGKRCNLFPFITKITIDGRDSKVVVDPDGEFRVDIELDKVFDDSLEEVSYGYLDSLSFVSVGKADIKSSNPPSKFISITIRAQSVFVGNTERTNLIVQNFEPISCRDLRQLKIEVEKGTINCPRRFDGEDNCIFLWEKTVQELGVLSDSTQVTDNGINERDVSIAIILGVPEAVKSLVFTNTKTNKTSKADLSKNQVGSNIKPRFYGLFKPSDSQGISLIDPDDLPSDIKATVTLESGSYKVLEIKVYKHSTPPTCDSSVPYGFRTSNNELSKTCYKEKAEFRLEMEHFFGLTEMVKMSVFLDNKFKEGMFVGSVGGGPVYEETFITISWRDLDLALEDDGEYNVVLTPMNDAPSLQDPQDKSECEIDDLYFYISTQKPLIKPTIVLVTLNNDGQYTTITGPVSGNSFMVKVSGLVVAAGVSGIDTIKLEVDAAGLVVVPSEGFVLKESKSTERINELVFNVVGVPKKGKNISLKVSGTSNMNDPIETTSTITTTKPTSDLKIILPNGEGNSCVLTNDFLEKGIEIRVSDGACRNYICGFYDKHMKEVSSEIIGKTFVTCDETPQSGVAGREIKGNGVSLHTIPLDSVIGEMVEGETYYLVVVLTPSDTEQRTTSTSIEIKYLNVSCESTKGKKWILKSDGSCGVCGQYETPTDNRSDCVLVFGWELGTMTAGAVIILAAVIIVPILVVRWRGRHRLFKSKVLSQIEEAKSRSVLAEGQSPNVQDFFDSYFEDNHSNELGDEVQRYVGTSTTETTTSSSPSSYQQNNAGRYGSIHQFQYDSYFSGRSASGTLTQSTPQGAIDMFTSSDMNSCTSTTGNFVSNSQNGVCVNGSQSYNSQLF